MKKKLEPEDENELEILKAVAQAWHGYSGSSTTRPMNEFDAHRRNFKAKPTRFKLEAMSKASKAEGSESGHWDFGQSLWDAYELVTISKKLESSLVLNDNFSESDHSSRSFKRRKESRSSLRNLFNRLSSRRFNEADLGFSSSRRFSGAAPDDGKQF